MNISPKKIIEVASKHMKRCLMLLVIRETPDQTQNEIQSTATRLAAVTTTTKQKNPKQVSGEDGEKLQLFHMAGWNGKRHIVWNTIWRFLGKLELSHDPAVSLLHTHPKD